MSGDTRDLLRLLELFLTGMRWTCVFRGDDRALTTHPPGQPERSLRWGLSGDDPGIDVVLVNDAAAGSAAALPVADLPSILAMAPGGKVSSRLGRDLIFPSLFAGRGAGGRLRAYLAAIKADRGLSSMTSTTLDAERMWRGQITFAPREEQWSEKTSWSEIGDRAIKGETALVAIHGQLGWDWAFSHYLLERHVDALLAPGGDAPTRIPLFVDCCSVRSIGLSRVVWDQVWYATGVAMSDQLVMGLFHAGFFHIYASEVERLREGAELDPNSELIAALMVYAQRHGSVTLGCNRDFVAFGPMLAEAPKRTRRAERALERLRPMGERFLNDSNLAIYDSDPGHVASGAIDHHATLASLSKTIAQRSEGRMSPGEAERLIVDLALQQSMATSALVPDERIEARARARVTGDRLRPDNIRLLTSAVRQAGFLRSVAPGVSTFSSSHFCDFLVAQNLRDAIASWLNRGDVDAFTDALNVAQLPYWQVAWTLNALDQKALDQMVDALPAFLQRHRFREGAARTDAVLVANTLSVLMALAAMRERRKANGGRRLLDQLAPTGVRLNSVLLPQLCFSKVSLNSWTFDDCYLGHAFFLDCDLTGARFINSSLAGARFERCLFSGGTSFAGSDVSGAGFVACDTAPVLFAPNAEGRLAGSNWSATRVDLETQDEALADVMARVSQWNVGAAALRLQGPEGEPCDNPWPVSVFQAFAYAARDVRPVCVRTPSNTDGVLVPHGDVRAIIASSFRQEGDTPAPDEQWRVIKEVLGADGRQVFACVGDDGRVWCVRTQGETARWLCVTELAGIRDVSIHVLASPAGPFEEDDVLIAAIRENANRPLAVAWLSARESVAPRVTEFEAGSDLEIGSTIRSMRWVRPTRAGAPLPELAIGLKGGGVSLCRWRVDASSWSRPAPIAGLEAVIIDAFGYVPRENVLIACGAEGGLYGFRHVGEGRVDRLYQFNTALRRVIDVAVLNSKGQMVVVGLTEDQLDTPPRERIVLWYLLSATGAVVAVVPRNVSELSGTAPIQLKPDPRRLVDLREAGEATATRARIRAALDRLVADRTTILVSPRINRTIEFILQDSGADGLRSELPESFDDEFGPRFRTLSLRIDDLASDQAAAVQRRYTEADLASVVFEAGRLRVKVAPSFATGVAAAKACLRVEYPASESEAPVALEKEFDLQLEWEDNPFVSDGTPVSGDQFFGLGEDARQVLGALLGSPLEHVILTTSRRAGKSSFVRHVAERLRNEQPRRIAVTISGEDVVRDGRVERAVQDALRQIGDHEERRDYRELGAIDLPTSSNVVEPLRVLTNAARQRGYADPFVIFIDEWGYLYDADCGTNLVNKGDALKSANIALCLTSVPSDFPVAKDNRQSWDYRFFRRQFDLSRLKRFEMERLIRAPLEGRDFEIGEQELDVVWRLSSGAPHDANILMHYAFKAAKADAQKSPGRKRPAIALQHILPRAGGPVTEAIAHLRQKYQAQQEYLLMRLSPEARSRFLDMAGDDVMPTVETPDADPGATWDRVQLGVPMSGGDRESDRRIFADAGYRALVEHGRTDLNTEAGPGVYKLWIPWGMADYFRQLRKQERK